MRCARTHASAGASGSSPRRLKERMNRGGYCSFPTATLAADARMTASTWIKGYRELERASAGLEAQGRRRQRTAERVLGGHPGKPRDSRDFSTCRSLEAKDRGTGASGSLETAHAKPLPARGEGVRTRWEVRRRSVLEGEPNLGSLQRSGGAFTEQELSLLSENERAVVSEFEAFVGEGHARWVA